MKLIVGLGNPGNQYNFTRHNFGFLALDFYAKTHGLDWEKNPKFGATYLRVGRGDDSVIFLKPQDFYNNSGAPVREFTRFYKIPASNVFVVCDDFNLPFGTLRYREKGSDGGNNGLKSLISELSSSDFPRLRLGTGNDQLRLRLGDTDFVLAKFTPEERKMLPTHLSTISARIDEFLY